MLEVHEDLHEQKPGAEPGKVFCSVLLTECCVVSAVSICSAYMSIAASKRRVARSRCAASPLLLLCNFLCREPAYFKASCDLCCHACVDPCCMCKSVHCAHLCKTPFF